MNAARRLGRLFKAVLGASALLLTAGCVTHITTNVTENPPPAEKFADFNHFELEPVRLAPEFAGNAANEKALRKIQENVSAKMAPLIAAWNAAGGSAPTVRTLHIEPLIRQIKFINATARVWTGALSGSSAVILTADITDKESGKVIASPMFYARAAAMGGAWTFGSTDNIMLTRIAGRLTDYLTLNYSAAVGGPTGAPTQK